MRIRRKISIPILVFLMMYLLTMGVQVKTENYIFNNWFIYVALCYGLGFMMLSVLAIEFVEYMTEDLKSD